MNRSLALAATVALLWPLAVRAAGPEGPKADPSGLIDHPGPNAAANLAGRWQVQGSLSTGVGTVAQATPVCDFKQAERTLSGTCKGPHAEGPVTGTIAGKHVSWNWQAKASTPIGLSSTAWFQGDLGADGVIRGSWRLEQLPGAKGEFTQTRK
jgi:hypothetical protein